MLGFQQEQQAVVRQAIADAGEGEWTSLYVELVTLGDVTSVEFLRKVLGGQDRVTDTTVHRPYRVLRKAMTTDEHGAWLSSSVTIERGGRYSFSFNYDEEPRWADGLPVEREGFLADLQRNPRPWAEIPDWHPVKQDYTEESWSAETKVF